MSFADADRGEANVLGLVLIAPVALALGFLVLWTGRQVESDAQVQSASAAAAQAAARQRNAPDGQAAARATATAMLSDTASCPGGPTVVVDASQWVPGGSVTVTVTCHPATDDLALGGASPRTFSASSTATLDEFRATVEP